MLAVHIYQQLSQLFHFPGCNKGTIDSTHVPSGLVQLPVENGLLSLIQFPFLKECGGGAALLYPEPAFGRGFLLSGADAFPAGSFPQHKAYGLNEDGFARPRLSCKRRKTLMEVYGQSIHEGDIGDYQLLQHSDKCLFTSSSSGTV